MASVTGVVLTKLDGSAKGGIVFAIETELGLPVKLVGLGESIGDLVPFDPAEFIDALVREGLNRCSGTATAPATSNRHDLAHVVSRSSPSCVASRARRLWRSRAPRRLSPTSRR